MIVSLRPTTCAVCGETEAVELYPANFELDSFNPEVFSARRSPDGLHYRMVRCRQCGLVRSDPAAGAGDLGRLYERSRFDYQAEVESLRRTYGRYLDRMAAHAPGRRGLLEVGCGNGFFLEEALEHGWSEVRGVEPAAHAVASAAPSVRDRIVLGVMTPGLFPEETFDAVCLFQVFDHLPDPGAILDACCRVLRPGGAVLCFNHNVDAFTNRLMGARSPIIDIEHTYLFSPRTMRAIFEAHGFEVVETGAARNTYSLRYLAHLVPLAAARSVAEGLLGVTRLGAMRATVPLGNLFLIARRS